MELLDMLDQVVDQTSFIRFASALEQDRVDVLRQDTHSPYQADPGNWRNRTIEDFLGAAVGWARSTDFDSARLSGVSPWRLFAEFLYAGKIYD